DLALTGGTIGLAIAIQNLLWGATQPFAGMVADRFGTGRVVAAGAIFYALGLFFFARATDAMEVYLGGGVLVALGLSGAGFSIVFGAVARFVPPEKRSLAGGIVGAGGSFGQFALAPIGQTLIADHGWSVAMAIFAGFALLLLPLAWLLRGKPATPVSSTQSLGDAIVVAARDPSYWLINAGFFVCGFHVAFVATYLPGMTSLCLLPAAVGAQALALIGLCNIGGSFLAGYLGGHIKMKWLLSAIYFIRAVSIAIFLVVPKTRTTFLVFACVLGFTWLGTVPLTSGLVGTRFGPRYLASLFGVVFFTHQVGAFFGAWLGGRYFDLTGNYDGVWKIAMWLALVAALIHLPIRERAIEADAAPVPA
ncbi:hypothetical protein AYO41_04700, partial [Verrucomicrobia bacterium SCGC AG-212-E04]